MTLLRNVAAGILVSSEVEQGTLFCDDVSVWVVPVLARAYFSWSLSECSHLPFHISSLFSLGELLPKFCKHRLKVRSEWLSLSPVICLTE